MRKSNRKVLLHEEVAQLLPPEVCQQETYEGCGGNTYTITSVELTPEVLVYLAKTGSRYLGIVLRFYPDVLPDGTPTVIVQAGKEK